MDASINGRLGECKDVARNKFMESDSGVSIDFGEYFLCILFAFKTGRDQFHGFLNPKTI